MGLSLRELSTTLFDYGGNLSTLHKNIMLNNKFCHLSINNVIVKVHHHQSGVCTSFRDLMPSFLKMLWT